MARKRNLFEKAIELHLSSVGGYYYFRGLLEVSCNTYRRVQARDLAQVPKMERLALVYCKFANVSFSNSNNKSYIDFQSPIQNQCKD